MEKKPFEEWTPAEVVAELDRHVVGQAAAKRAVAIALRNRWRRKRVDPKMRDDVLPKNILMIGPTGVGKTEIARRLAKLLGAPFLKVEATKYTEVGYVGKDVESMVRDLVEASINLVQQEAKKAVAAQAKNATEERLLDLLLPPGPYGIAPDPAAGELSTREKLRERLHAGAFEDREVEIEVRERVAPSSELFAMPGFDQLDNNLQDMLGSLVPKRTKRRKMRLRDARPVLEAEEAQRMVDMDRVIPQALELAQQSGIVFLDELDKIAEPETATRSQAAVSREGVQRDLLPIIEGATVNTKYGPVKTDHVLFIGAGAFHKSKPSDLIPELQGRFPIRVELTSLGVDDFVRILREPEHSLLQQYEALLATEQVTLTFDDDAVRGMAETAARVNESMENIGARRLHTILERVLEEVSFTAPEIVGQSVTVTAQYVRDRVSDVARDQDLGRFIL